MLKLIDSASFFPEDEPTVTIVDFNNLNGLTKQAADSQITEYVSTILPKPNKVYLHILAMGASQYYGANRNADSFPEENLIKYYKTFETSPAHLFRNHNNKNPAIAIGVVIKAIWNPRMKRVELIVEMDKTLGADILQRIEDGEFPSTSMACRTEKDTCSVCGNEAGTRQAYCEHLKHQLGKMYPDGRKVVALNTHPLRFFDISVVWRPADVTSSILTKVASHGEHIKSSAELAEEVGLSDEPISPQMNKSAEMKKLSEFIKEVDGGVIVNADVNMDKLLSHTQDPDMKLIPILKNFKISDIAHTLAHLGISPSLIFLAELLAIKSQGMHMIGSGKAIANLVNSIDRNRIELPKEEFEAVGSPIESISKLLAPSMIRSSLHSEFVEKRAYNTDYSDFSGIHSESNIGYTGNLGHIEQTPFEKWKAASPSQDSSKMADILKTLLIIGGQAIAMKWMITHAIEKHVENSAHGHPYGAKIVLVKSAQELRLTYKLAKAAMVKSLKR